MPTGVSYEPGAVPAMSVARTVTALGYTAAMGTRLVDEVAMVVDKVFPLSLSVLTLN